MSFNNHYGHLSHFLGCDVLDYAASHLPADYSTLIRTQTLTPYIRTLIARSHYYMQQRGGRDDVEFITSLIYSRLVEWYLLENLPHLFLQFNGTDKDSLITEYCSNRPDFKDFNVPEYYEVLSTFGMYYPTNQAVISQSKRKNLATFSEANTLSLLIVDICCCTYVILPFSKIAFSDDILLCHQVECCVFEIPTNLWQPF